MFRSDFGLRAWGLWSKGRCRGSFFVHLFQLAGFERGTQGVSGMGRAMQVALFPALH